MKARSFCTATVVAALLAPGVARAEGLEGRFSIAFQAGTQSEISGDLLKGSTGTLIEKPTTIQSKRYKDVYAPDLRLQGLVGYGVAPKLEIIARGTWYEADASGVEAGTRDGKTVFAFFEPYKEVGFEAGLRYYISAQTRLKSYITPIVGVRFLKENLVSFSVPDAGSAILNVPFSQKSTVPVFGLDLGFTFDFGRHFFVGLDAMLRYQTAAKQFDGLATLTTIDDSDGRWTAPVAGTVGVRF